MDNGRWITYNGRRIFIDTSKYMNSYIKNKGKKKEKTFEDISTTDELLDFNEKYFNERKKAPYYVPTNNKGQKYVNGIEKIDNDTIEYFVIDDSNGTYRKAKSSIKNFKKNYKILGD